MRHELAYASLPRQADDCLVLLIQQSCCLHTGQKTECSQALKGVSSIARRLCFHPDHCAASGLAYRGRGCGDRFGWVQAVQSGHRAAGATGDLLRLPRQPPAAADLQRGQGAAEDCHVLLPGSQPQLIEQGSCRDPTTSLTTTAEHLSSKQEAAVVVAPEGKDTSNAGCFSAMGKAANL